MSQLCTDFCPTVSTERGVVSHRKLIAMFKRLRFPLFCLITTALTACDATDALHAPALSTANDGGTIYNGHTRSTDPELKIAFLGDQGVDEKARHVLQLVADEQADALIVLGDLSYGNAPPAEWAAQFREVLGDDFPYFGVIGNHDVREWFDPGGFSEILQERLSSIADAKCEGEYGIDSSCSFRGLSFVMSGVGTYGSDHEAYLESALQSSDAIFKLCIWHKNQHDTQLGSKADEVGWEAYRVCQRNGVPVLNGHEHSYSRTQLLTAIGDRSQMHGATLEMSDFELGPGRTFVVVSGLGGEGQRDRAPDHAQDGWWASTYAQNDQQLNGIQTGTDPDIEDGALFVTFHVDDDPYKARGYFKTVSGEVRDELTWRVTDRGAE